MSNRNIIFARNKEKLQQAVKNTKTRLWFVYFLTFTHEKGRKIFRPYKYQSIKWIVILTSIQFKCTSKINYLIVFINFVQYSYCFLSSISPRTFFTNNQLEYCVRVLEFGSFHSKIYQYEAVGTW